MVSPFEVVDMVRLLLSIVLVNTFVPHFTRSPPLWSDYSSFGGHASPNSGSSFGVTGDLTKLLLVFPVEVTSIPGFRSKVWNFHQIKVPNRFCLPFLKMLHSHFAYHPDYAVQVTVNIFRGLQGSKSVLQFKLEHVFQPCPKPDDWDTVGRKTDPTMWLRSSFKLIFRVPLTSRWSLPVLNLLITEKSINICFLSAMMKSSSYHQGSSKSTSFETLPIKNCSYRTVPACWLRKLTSICPLWFLRP